MALDKKAEWTKRIKDVEDAELTAMKNTLGNSLFIPAIFTFSGREYKYDPAQRVDTVIYHDEKKFMTSKSSKWQRGRRIVSYLTEVFRATQIQQANRGNDDL